MGRRGLAVSAWTVVSLCSAGAGHAQTDPPWVPEFELLCHPTETVRDVPPEDPNADPFGDGPWYVNDDRSLWVGWQPLVSGKAGNRLLWIKPPGQRLEVAGRRLDGEASSLEVARNDAYLTSGFEPNRLIFPEPGCWEVTATAGEQELVFVVEVEARANGRPRE